MTETTSAIDAIIEVFTGMENVIGDTGVSIKIAFEDFKDTLGFTAVETWASITITLISAALAFINKWSWKIILFIGILCLIASAAIK